MADKTHGKSPDDTSSLTEAELLEIKNPFEKSLASFERFINWGLAISTGTLLWFIGNFDKFTTKSIYQNESSSFALKSALPNKYIFIMSIIVLFASVLILSYFRVKQYYNSYKFDYSRELFKASYKAIFDKQKLAKSDPSQAKALLVNIEAESDEAYKRAIKAGSWVGLVNEFIILEDRSKKYLTISVILYIIGLLLAIIFFISYICIIG